MPGRMVFSARIVLLASTAILLVACAREPANRTDADLVVARVNGTPVTLLELKEELAYGQGISRSAASQATAGEVSGALRRLLERAVVLREGSRLGVAASESEVEEEVRKYRADFPPGGLEKILLQQGIAMGEWRERMRQSLLYRKSTEAIANRLAAVTEEEVREAYRQRADRSGHPEQIQVRQLIFDSRENALLARAKILDGARLDDVILHGREGEPVPAFIDLGYLSRDDLPVEIADDLFRLPPGGVSGVVRRNRSYSLFLVVGTRKADPGSFQEAAPQIREGLLRGKQEATFRRWLEEKMATADIKVQERILEQIAEGKR
jgi:parvulin-like peptidyl-prolyl isomerase